MNHQMNKTQVTEDGVEVWTCRDCGKTYSVKNGKVTTLVAGGDAETLHSFGLLASGLSVSIVRMDCTGVE